MDEKKEGPMRTGGYVAQYEAKDQEAQAAAARETAKTEQEIPKPIEPNVMPTPSMELEILQMAEAAKAAETKRDQERETQRLEALAATQKMPMTVPNRGPTSKQLYWALGIICIGAIVAVAIWSGKRDGTAAVATATRAAEAVVPSTIVTRPPSAVRTATVQAAAAPPTFAGQPGWTVCMPARTFAPTGCANVQSVPVNGLNADWSRPVYNCEYGQARGNDLCDCRVCERIPN